MGGSAIKGVGMAVFGKTKGEGKSIINWVVNASKIEVYRPLLL